MKQHILVTGGQGSLGQQLVPQLVRYSWRIYVKCKLVLNG
jgi:FlaA1/EpsC-like NDP-sugar epimerase